VDLPRDPLLRQPLRDWLSPASDEAGPFALSNALLRLPEAWDDFFLAGLFDFGAWDLARGVTSSRVSGR
jgi:hypothetical protein